VSLLGQTLILYALAGAGVAAAVYLRHGNGSRSQRAFRVATALVFWPLYVPLLLAGENRGSAASPPAEAPTDDLTGAIAQVERELDAALAGLAGWADEALARQGRFVRRLPAAWAL
jgi:hypothetical protein